MSNATPRTLRSLLASLASGVIRLFRRLGLVYALGWTTALGLLVAFAQLTDGVLEGDFTPLNEQILLTLHAHATPTLDWVALALSDLGGIIGTALIGATAVLLLLMFKRPIDAATLTIVLAGGSFLTVALKHTFRQPRPALFESLAPETTFSFPSGHSLMGVCLYGFLSALLFMAKPRVTWPFALALLLVPLGIMASRLYLGVHWFTDVVAGALVATVWLTVCLMLRRAALRRLSPRQD